MTTTYEKLQAKLKGSYTELNNGSRYKDLLPRLYCRKNLGLSIQASKTHYCSPRDDEGPYTHVEVGFPSRVIEKLRPYAEDPKRMTKSVYGWVPLGLLAEIIDEYGGLKS